ncbi:hypothetical protein, partial [Burkholderia gladioli]|uniref:hypothetical protein n=1 Tax=Burkholderia gladioli TaxID=28095 RepID=UPI001ABBB0AD
MADRERRPANPSSNHKKTRHTALSLRTGFLHFKTGERTPPATPPHRAATSALPVAASPTAVGAGPH